MKIKTFILGLALLTTSTLKAQTKLTYTPSGEAIEKGIKAFDKENFKSALKYYSKVHIGDTNYFFAQYEKGLTYYAMEEYQKAIDLANEQLKEESRYIQGYYGLLGQAYGKLKKYDESLAAYATGIEMFPTHFKLYYKRALTYEDMEKWEEMAKDLQLTVKYAPFISQAHLKLAELAKEEGQYAKAMMCFNSYILIESRDNLEFLSEYNDYLKGEYDNEPKEISLSEDDYSDIDELIVSQIAMNKKYKTPNKLSLPMVKQNYLLFTELQKRELGNGFWDTFYVPFFLRIMKDEKFNDLMYYSLQSSTNNGIVSVLNKNIKLIRAFPDYAGSTWQEEHSTNYEMFNGEMTTVHYFWNSSSVVSGIGKMVDGEPVGEFYYHATTGRLSAIGHYDNDGERDGLWTYYHFNGAKSGAEMYEAGDQEGNDSSFYDNGVIKSVVPYTKGISNGKAYSFAKTGIPDDVVTYLDDKLDGPAQYYYGVGILHYDVNYTEGDLNGRFIEYFDNGVVSQDVEFKEGLRTGLSKSYYKNGQKSAELNYEEGEYNGTITKWYEDGTLKEEGVYEEGINIGTLKKYNPNGSLESEENFDENGKQSGEYKEYDKKGNLNMVLIYKKGDLVAYKIYHRDGSLIKEAKKKGGEFLFENYYSDGTKKAVGVYLSGDLGKNGLWKFYNENGVLDSESSYSNGEINGKARDYYSTGKKFTTTSYKDGDANGLYVKYYRSGQVFQQGYYVGDEQEGVWLEYYPDGTLSEESFFVDDELNGPKKYYAVNGKLDLIDYFENGINVAFEEFDSTGVSIHKETFTSDSSVYTPIHITGEKVREFTKKGNIFHGPSQNFYVSGKISSTGSYWNGRKNGLWTTYFPDGQINASGTYFYGQKEGDWVYYHENGQVSLEETYVNGNRHGLRFWYHDNGKLDSKKTYENGVVNGLAYYYDGNGVLQMVRDYFYGKIMAYTYLGTDGELKEMIPITNETCECKSYFSNGNPSREFSMNAGNFNGDYIEYFENGKVFSKTSYENDNTVNTKFAYWDNGNVREEEPHKLGEIHGIAKYFNKDGSLSKTETYIYGTRHGIVKLYKGGKVVKTKMYYDGGLISK